MIPRFIDGRSGRLFTIYHPPATTEPFRGHVLFVPPWAEELNRCRRMVAMQSRRLADAGFGVLVPDLFGCGDSEGEFAEATWEVWADDLRVCRDSLEGPDDAPLTVWGLRLGAVLATEVADDLGAARILMWQPVLDGAVFMKQYLRLRTARDRLAGIEETVSQLQERLEGGESLVVGGYELTPALAASVGERRLGRAPAETSVPIDWYEVVSEAGKPIALGSRKVVDALRADGLRVRTQTVAGDPFWATIEIGIAPTLIDATSTGLLSSPADWDEPGD